MNHPLYTPTGIMTVADLISKLQQFPSDTAVAIPHHNGNGYCDVGTIEIRNLFRVGETILETRGNYSHEPYKSEQGRQIVTIET